MIEYYCKLEEGLEETVLPEFIQEHLTIMELYFMREEKIHKFIQKFHSEGIWHHRYFAKTRHSANCFANLVEKNETWLYTKKYLELKGFTIHGPNIGKNVVNLDSPNIFYYC